MLAIINLKRYIDGVSSGDGSGDGNSNTSLFLCAFTSSSPDLEDRYILVDVSRWKKLRPLDLGAPAVGVAKNASHPRVLHHQVQNELPRLFTRTLVHRLSGLKLHQDDRSHCIHQAPTTGISLLQHVAIHVFVYADWSTPP